MSQPVQIHIEKIANQDSVHFGETVLDGDYFEEPDQELAEFNECLVRIAKSERRYDEEVVETQRRNMPRPRTKPKRKENQK